MSDDRVRALTPAYTAKTIAAATLVTVPPAQASMVTLTKFAGGGPVFVRSVLRGSTSTERALGADCRYWGKLGTVYYDLGPVNKAVASVVSNVRGISEELRLVGVFDYLGVTGTLADDSLVIDFLPLGFASE